MGEHEVPNRILRESALTSPSLAELSAEGERLFYRLTLVADDLGRYEADPRIVLSRCFPLFADKLRVKTVERWYAELESAGIVATYQIEDRVYGHFLKWTKHQRVRSDRSKYPEPPAASCGELRPLADNGGHSRLARARSGDGVGDGDVKRTSTSAGSDPARGSSSRASPPTGPDPAEVEAVTAYYLKRMDKNPAQYKITTDRKRTVARRLKEFDVATLEAAIDECACSDYHMGKNDGGKLFNDLERHILKSEKKVEGWLEQRAHRMKGGKT